MLNFTRRVGQKILIGDDIKIRINCIDGGRVSIGIEAPKNVRVLRAEILEPHRAVARANLNERNSFVGNALCGRNEKTAMFNFKLIDAAASWMSKWRERK